MEVEPTVKQGPEVWDFMVAQEEQIESRHRFSAGAGLAARNWLNYEKVSDKRQTAKQWRVSKLPSSCRGVDL